MARIEHGGGALRTGRRVFARGRVLLFAAVLAGVVVLGLIWVGPGASSRVDHPNILVISLCSVRPDHMSVYGYGRETTPNFNALARDGVMFEHAVTQWPKTAPAFAAIMSGKYGHSTGVMRITPHQHLGDQHETLAEVLKAGGYETAIFTSSPALNRQTNILQGFETIVETFRETTPTAAFAAVARGATSWLERERDKPFLLWVHYNNAHYPYRGDPEAPELFVDDEYYDGTRKVSLNYGGVLPLPISPQHPYYRQIVRPDLGGVHPSAVLPERPSEYAFYVARYDAGIHSADRMAGGLLDAIRRLGLFDNTIVVVVGDHGEALGEHSYYFEHGRFPYDDCARVPLIIRPPGGVARRRVSEPVASFGLAPTLLELCGLPAPRDMEAHSLWPDALGRPRAGYVFTESGYQLDYTLSLRDESWKLIYVPNEVQRTVMAGTEYELYDLPVDPGEQNNLVEDRTDIVARLRGALETWSDPWIHGAYSGVAPDAPVDDETLKRLRSLGYVGEGD